MTRHRGRLAAAGCAVLLLGACGSQDPSAQDRSGRDPSSGSSASGGRHTMKDGSTMSDAEMQDMEDTAETGGADGTDGTDAESTPAPGQVTHREDGPSAAAAMICSLEIAEAVQSAFALPDVPTATDGWAEQAYTCTYRLPTSTVTLSVKDLDRARAGREWFDALGRRLEGSRPIKGLPNLGFPAVETPDAAGSVAFLKDDKTLWVDAGDVAARDLAPGFTRTGTAYNIASHVIACWTE